MKPDKEHPFGHGRIEYISGFAVSVAIIVMGFELGKSSAIKLMHPAAVDASLLTMAILLASIGVKLYMYIYNRSVGQKIRSRAMQATATDSLSDTVATSVVLLSMVISRIWSVNIDAWGGILVSLFILRSGYLAAKDTLSPLLGSAPDPDLVRKIRDVVMRHDAIVGIHDLVIHDYGPGRVMISLHAEVPEDGNILEIHEQIDHIEKEISESLGCEAVIHMDPIATKDEIVTAARDKVAQLVCELDSQLTIHDFRMVQGKNNTNLIFDAVIPMNSGLSEKQVKLAIEEMVQQKLLNCRAVVHIDKGYSEN